ncbi:MAG: hypothetical protein IV100_19410 [Myxococcales bacterium]|nr:hypothetical protein [Myxococcales bacterium]
MNRRTLLSSALPVGLGLLLGPTWLREAFGERKDGCPSTAERASWLKSALTASKASGKPLLVFTTPAAGDLAWERGNAFGAWLNHGSEDTLARFAEVEVVAGSTAGLIGAIGKPLKGDPLFWLVTEGEAQGFDAPLNKVVSQKRGDVSEQDAIIDTQLATLDRLLKDAVGGQKARDHRASAARTRLSTTDVATLTTYQKAGGAGTPPALSLVDRGAAILAAGLGGTVPQSIVKALADAARARVVKQRIPGTLWGQANACGSDTFEGVEPDPDEQMVDCGMGFVPERSQRFLHFYTCQG